jgi:Cu2+-exporting ATPase
VSERIAVPAFIAQRAERAASEGYTPVLVALAGSVRAMAALGDVLRSDAAVALRRIRALGHQVGILSGDHPAVVARVADELGVPLEFAQGAQTPEGKLHFVRDRVVAGSVVMVGDGVNDAPALRAATVGVAVQGGAEASLLSADAYLKRPGVFQVALLLEGARRTLATVRRGVVVSIAYNVVGVGLAVFGFISPLIAAVLMPLSSLTVVANAYRSQSFGGER